LISRRQSRELLEFSSKNLLIQIASKVVVSTDVIVVGVIFGGLAAGIYGIPAKVFALVFAVGMASTTLLFPFLSELEGAEDRERQERYLLSGIRLGLVVVVAVGLPLLILPGRILDAWLSSEFDVAEAAPVLFVLMSSIFFAQPTHLLAQFLVARGKHGRLAVARLATVVANLLLSIGLAFAVGLWGVALATLLTEAVSATLILPYLLRRELSFSRASLAEAWLRPVVLGGIAALPTLLLFGRHFGVNSLSELAAVVVCWLVAYGLLVWRFVMDETERRTLRGTLGRDPAAVADPDQPLP
jgi:O-antigen/teichoic acid export membrane protein